ncbi:MAG: DUF2203 domain-containing protein [Solirubrobacteraceae bacterium]|jgi:hypothetical protein
MRHTRHYTLEQAQAARGRVAERVRWARSASRALEAFGPRLAAGICALDPESGGSYPCRELAGPLVKLSRAISDLESDEVVVRDVDGGLVDFPAIRDGREVYLCWQLDEDEIRHWHPIDTGFASRRPL